MIKYTIEQAASDAALLGFVIITALNVKDETSIMLLLVMWLFYVAGRISHENKIFKNE